MKLIGLTGGIATGKSTVTQYLILKKNVPVIDCDQLAREVMQPTHSVYQQVKAAFPSCFHPHTNQLDRKALGDLIFHSLEARQRLNKLTHGAIRRRILQLVLWYWVCGYRWVVIDAPLLIESHLDQWMSEVVVVYCSEDLQRSRLMNRNSYTLEEANQRIQAQLPMTKKLKKATYVLNNDSSNFNDLYSQIDTFLKQTRPSLFNTLIWWWGTWLSVLGALVWFGWGRI